MTNNNLPIMNDYCGDPKCADLPSHFSGYHDADADIIAAANNRELIKKWDAFFLDMREECLNFLPHPHSMPFGAEVEDEDDLADDFADWGTMQIIRQLMR